MSATLSSVYLLQLLPTCCLPTVCLPPPPFAAQLLPASVCLHLLLPQLLPACSAAAALLLYACRFPAAFPTGCHVLASYLVAQRFPAAPYCLHSNFFLNTKCLLCYLPVFIHLQPVCLPTACRPSLGLLLSCFVLNAFLQLLAACMVTSS
jgi:hypothetical protein